MKFTINNNLRLLTCPLLLAGAVCCSSGNDGDTPAPGPGPDPSPVTGDVLAYVTSADGNRLMKQFDDTRKMMKAVAGGGMKMPKMPGGMMRR